MKKFFIFLMAPVFSFGQTVHIKDEKIVYEGKEKFVGLTTSETFSRIQKALPAIINKYKVDENSAHSIKARGELKLKTPYNKVGTVAYSITVNATDNGYDYLIDSVSFTERVRGERAITKSSQEIIENMGETGKIVGDTEKLLNDTDMKFQKLLALLRSETGKK